MIKFPWCRVKQGKSHKFHSRDEETDSGWDGVTGFSHTKCICADIGPSALRAIPRVSLVLCVAEGQAFLSITYPLAPTWVCPLGSMSRHGRADGRDKPRLFFFTYICAASSRAATFSPLQHHFPLDEPFCQWSIPLHEHPDNGSGC